jgi:alpha-D-ribose 1-methylphosphonate 5-triphosphate synthase subunit PhnH
MTTQALDGGFTAQPEQAARAFRAILESVARPGTIWPLTGAKPPAPLSIAAGTALLTLADATTPVFLAGGVDCPAVRQWLTFHVGAPLVGPDRAMFAVGFWADLTPLDRFHPGDPDYPDRAATLIVLLDQLSQTGARLTGPGIATEARLSLPEVGAFQRNAARFPLGLDFMFVAGSQIAGLPRSTKVEAA